MPNRIPDLPFEVTSSWCYRFAKDQAIPEILRTPEVQSGLPVKLINLTRQILDTYLTPEQQGMTYQRARSDGVMKVGGAVKFFVPFLAKETGQLINLGSGMFRLPTVDDINYEKVEDAAIDAAEPDDLEAEVDTDGTIYAFTFPMIQKVDGPFPIKVGRASGNAQARIGEQGKSSAMFEQPVMLSTWAVQNHVHMESAIHKVLKTRNKWRVDAPGQEWFNTTLFEIDSIIKFIQSDGAMPG